MRKTGLASVAELTLHAVRLRLIDAPTGAASEPNEASDAQGRFLPK